MAEPRPASFESALRDLEERVARLERGDLDLDDALRLFEEGVALVRTCHERLDAADARILALTGSPEAVKVSEFQAGEPSPGSTDTGV
jgi:exodeoxyribonuclease VII small subunit